MITSIAGFLKYFDGVNRRAMRDIAALPPEANGWAPPAGTGENAWGINQLVGHMCGSRLYFASAFRGEGWISPPPPDMSQQELWVPALQKSFDDFAEIVGSLPDSALERRVEMIDSGGASLSGWRLLMMMAEHDIHHRSQIDTYAGLNGWDPPQIYNRSAETIGGLQAEQRAKHGREGEGHPL